MAAKGAAGDPLSFARHASLEVLLIGVPPIRRTTFEAHAQQICTFSRIALRDIPPDQRGERAALSASPRLPGHVLFSFVESHARSTAYLEDFDAARRLFGVIGIVDCAEWDDLAEAHTEFQQALRRHPKVIATRCYAFNPSERHEETVDGVVTIPDSSDGGLFMGTLLGELASSILSELSNMVRQACICAMSKCS